ncbi:MAG: hypothetical protein J6X67_03890 [Treponema sp.]|nr:hypothetical protein [Treponema sp.]
MNDFYKVQDNLGLHDHNLINMLMSPLTGCGQIWCSTGTSKIEIIKLSGIRKITPDSQECFSEIFNGEGFGDLQAGELNKTKNGFVLKLQGRLGKVFKEYDSIIWTFEIEANHITFEEKDMDESTLDKFAEIDYFDLTKCICT